MDKRLGALQAQDHGDHAMRLHLTTLLLLLTLPACLANRFEIQRPELERLMQVPPQERGQAVRAVQQFLTSEEPPPAPAWSPADATPTQNADAGYYSDSYSGGSAAPIFFWYTVPVPYASYGPRAYAPAATYARPAAVHADGLALGAGALKTRDSKAIAAAIVAGIAVAVATTVVLAATEGARYDGLIAVHPHHPVHLMGADGQVNLVGLDDLTLDDLRGDVRAIVVANEGAGLWQRGRAPLDRQGGAWQLDGGWTAPQIAPGLAVSGGGARLGLGYFFNQYTGLLLTGDLATGNDWESGGDFWLARWGAELQWMPIGIHWFHLGGALGGGWQHLDAGGGALPTVKRTDGYASLAVQMEFDLTTRLAFALRFGELWQPFFGPTGNWTESLVPGATIGLHVY